jgi:hypothetical protein
MRHFSILALLAFAGLFSCKKDKTPSVDEDVVTEQTCLRMKPVFGPTDMVLDSVYTMSNGFQIKFTELKAYFTDIQASDGTTLRNAALFDFRETGNLIFQADQVVANPSSIQFGIGVPQSVNHNDPSVFPASNPLNIAIANDMHWDWNPGYIFFKVEAKVDTIVDGITNCDHNLVYHVGTDPYFTTKTLSNLNWSTSGGVHLAWFKLDLKNFFENGASLIDVKTEFTSHSMMPQQSGITEKARQNFAASISVL